jgi:hypothetical protein
MHIKTQSTFATKLGVLCARVPGCTKTEVRQGVLLDRGTKRYPKVRGWTFDQCKLCNHFGIQLEGDDDTQRTIRECLPKPAIEDPETEAREFVAHYLETMDE